MRWQIISVALGLFAFLDRAWGPHIVDCFADQYNKQLPHFTADSGALVLKR